MDETFVEPFNFRHLLRLVRIKHEDDVKVAVSGMTNDRSLYKRRNQVLLSFGDAFGQPRNRHANIGRPELRALASRLIRIGSVMARSPKLAAIIRLGCPGKVGATMLKCDLLDRFRLLFYTALDAMEFEPQRRRDSQVEL